MLSNLILSAVSATELTAFAGPKVPFDNSSVSLIHK